jgi:hypothetical protein
MRSTKVSIGLVTFLLGVWVVVVSLHRLSPAVEGLTRNSFLTSSGTTHPIVNSVHSIIDNQVLPVSHFDVTPKRHLGIESIPRDIAKYAYITMMHGIDNNLAYRGFLFNVLLAKEILSKSGSTADFIVLVGFSKFLDVIPSVIQEDLALLRRHNIILHYLPRLRDILRFPKVNFMEMALLKLSSWNLTNYDRVQYMDADVLPRRNMDCLFKLERNTFNTGTASPLNSGWFLAIPNQKDFNSMIDLAINRMNQVWKEESGWGTPIGPYHLHFRQSARTVQKWNFNGASLDQGLLTHYFILHEGRAQLLDGKQALCCFDGSTRISCALPSVCDGVAPMDMFYHFTGRNKPWLRISNDKKDRALKFWVEEFNALQLDVNASSLSTQNLRSPLGYFHPNK